jgi:hypothetical protein
LFVTGLTLFNWLVTKISATMARIIINKKIITSLKKKMCIAAMQTIEIYSAIIATDEQHKITDVFATTTRTQQRYDNLCNKMKQ